MHDRVAVRARALRSNCLCSSFPGAASYIAATLNAWPTFASHQFSTHVCSYVCDDTDDWLADHMLTLMRIPRGYNRGPGVGI